MHPDIEKHQRKLTDFPSSLASVTWKLGLRTKQHRQIYDSAHCSSTSTRIKKIPSFPWDSRLCRRRGVNQLATYIARSRYTNAHFLGLVDVDVFRRILTEIDRPLLQHTIGRLQKFARHSGGRSDALRSEKSRYRGG